MLPSLVEPPSLGLPMPPRSSRRKPAASSARSFVQVLNSQRGSEAYYNPHKTSQCLHTVITTCLATCLRHAHIQRQRNGLEPWLHDIERSCSHGAAGTPGASRGKIAISVILHTDNVHHFDMVKERQLNSEPQHQPQILANCQKFLLAR